MRAAVRTWRLTGVCAALAALLAVPAGASAAPFTGSAVTAPGPDARPLYDANLGPSAPANRIAVSGTVTGGDGDGELRCYAATELDPLHFRTVDDGPIAVTAGRFAVDVPASELPAGACRLRFVPDEAAGLDDEALAAFSGPRVLPLTRELFPSPGDPSIAARVRITGAAAGAFATWEDVANGGAPSTLPVVDPGTLRTGASVFAGGAAIPQPALGDPDPVALSVDGRPALTPGPAGLQVRELAVAADGSVTSLIVEPLADAGGGPAPGVALERRVTASADGRAVTTTDRWTSTDGRAHALTIPYEHRFAPGSGYRLPWASGAFSAYPGPGARALPLPPGRVSTIEARHSAGDPAPGLDNPLGALTVSTRPDALRVTDQHALRMVFRRTVPAQGALELVQRFATSPDRAGLDALIAAAEADAARSAPRIAFTSPTAAAGFAPGYVLTGRVDVLGAVGSLLVNGMQVTPNPDGTFALPLDLRPGANPMSASVTDAAGDGASTEATVTFSPPPASATYVRPTYRRGVVSLPITCRALAGTSCEVRARLTARFLRKVGRRRRYKTVLLHAKTFRVPAQTSTVATIRLSKRNRALVRKYRRIRARLELVQQGVTDAAGKPARRYWGVTLK